MSILEDLINPSRTEDSLANLMGIFGLFAAPSMNPVQVFNPVNLSALPGMSPTPDNDMPAE